MNVLVAIIVVIGCCLSAISGLQTYIYLPDKFIQEEIPIGSLIADVAEELEIESNRVQTKMSTTTTSSSTNSGESQHYTFLEDTKSSTENTYFLLDSITGRLTSKRYLDRESMCVNRHCANACGDDDEHGGSCVMQLRMLIIPSYQIVSLNVIVQDINDNKPMFRVDLLNLTVSENVPIGYRIPLDLAYDPDVGTNSIQSYSLIQQNTLFSTTSSKKLEPENYFYELVQPQTVSVNGSNEPQQHQLQLIVKRGLDRETIAQHNLTIVACDGGQPSNCGQLRLVINIGDLNDNSPIFRRDVYEFSVVENAPRGTLVGRIEAYDLDAGLNAKIRYKLVNVPVEQSDYFEIDELTGVIFLAKPIDFEIEKQFVFKAEARDFGVGSLPAYTQIEINVVDTNDNVPEISVSFLHSLPRNSTWMSKSNTSELLIYMAENTEANSFIAHVSISDRDAPPHDQIAWRVWVNSVDIASSAHLNLNKLNTNSFTLLTGTDLDRETTPSIHVSIWASNPAASSSLSASHTYYNFTIVLLDENDNAPRFSRDLYELNIAENNNVGQQIHKFDAVDVDEAENGRVVYAIQPDTIDWVRLDAESGVLRANRVFDREETSAYEFHVVARDKGNRESRAQVKLNIIDMNDNKPKIVYNGTKELLNSTYLLVKVDENSPVHTEIGRFECRDVDENSQTRLTLMSSYDVALSRVTGVQTMKNDGPFSLDASTGRFVVSKRLDREQQDSYDYVLVCADTMFNTSLSIQVSINDVNDNCPRSLNKTNSDYIKSVFINRDWDVYRWSVPLFTEYYTDEDMGKNARLRFTLETHTVEFEANASESTDQVYGVKLSLKPSEAERMRLGKYVLKLKISDLGNPSCVKTDTFVVFVGDNTTRTQFDLIEKIKSHPDSYMNDEFVYVEETPVRSSTNMTSHSRLSGALKSLKSTDYLIMASLLSTLIVIGSILSLVGLVFLCQAHKNKTTQKKKTSNGLEVKNYSEYDETSAAEMNNLLSSNSTDAGIVATAATNHRLSISLKSTDQSQSADSVASNITFARDTSSTSSSSSSSTDENQHHNQHQHQHIVELIGVVHKHKQQQSQQYGPRVTFGTLPRDDYHLKQQQSLNRKSSDFEASSTPAYMSSFSQRAIKTHNHHYHHQQYQSAKPVHHHQLTAHPYHHHHHQQQHQQQVHLSSQSTYSTSLMMTPTSTSSCSDTNTTNNCAAASRVGPNEIIILPASTSSTSAGSSSSSNSSSPPPPPPPPPSSHHHYHLYNHNHHRHYVDINDEEEDEDDDDDDNASSCLVVNNDESQQQQILPSNNNTSNRTHRYSSSGGGAVSISTPAGYLRSSAV